MSCDMPGTQLGDIDYDELDPGIREVVRRLNDAHFTTTDSGDGYSKAEHIASGDAEAIPHVYILVEAGTIVAECERLMALVESWGLVVDAVGEGPIWIQATYDPTSAAGVVMLAGVLDVDIASSADN